jgi:hypothetical protein
MNRTETASLGNSPPSAPNTPNLEELGCRRLRLGAWAFFLAVAFFTVQLCHRLLGPAAQTFREQLFTSARSLEPSAASPAASVWLSCLAGCFVLLGASAALIYCARICGALDETLAQLRRQSSRSVIPADATAAWPYLLPTVAMPAFFICAGWRWAQLDAAAADAAALDRAVVQNQIAAACVCGLTCFFTGLAFNELRLFLRRIQLSAGVLSPPVVTVLTPSPLVGQGWGGGSPQCENSPPPHLPPSREREKTATTVNGSFPAPAASASVAAVSRTQTATLRADLARLLIHAAGSMSLFFFLLHPLGLAPLSIQQVEAQWPLLLIFAAAYALFIYGLFLISDRTREALSAWNVAADQTTAPIGVRDGLKRFGPPLLAAFWLTAMTLWLIFIESAHLLTVFLALTAVLALTYFIACLETVRRQTAEFRAMVERRQSPSGNLGCPLVAFLPLLWLAAGIYVLAMLLRLPTAFAENAVQPFLERLLALLGALLSLPAVFYLGWWTNVVTRNLSSVAVTLNEKANQP